MFVYVPVGFVSHNQYITDYSAASCVFRALLWPSSRSCSKKYILHRTSKHFTNI